MEVNTYCNEFSRKIIAPLDMVNVYVISIDGQEHPIVSTGYISSNPNCPIIRYSLYETKGSEITINNLVPDWK